MDNKPLGSDKDEHLDLHEEKLCEPLGSNKDMFFKDADGQEGNKDAPKMLIFVLRQAGAGKSTFFKHMTDTWRNPTSTAPQFSDASMLQQFEFLFYVSSICRRGIFYFGHNRKSVIFFFFEKKTRKCKTCLDVCSRTIQNFALSCLMPWMNGKVLLLQKRVGQKTYRVCLVLMVWKVV